MAHKKPLLISLALLLMVVGFWSCASGYVDPLSSSPAPDQLVVTSDGGQSDAPPTADTGTVPKQTVPDGAPAGSGQVVITEIMANPGVVLDSKGEWFEIFNPTAASVDLINWTLRDKSTNQHAITSSLVLKPGQYMVLGNNKNVATNGSVKVDYAYSGFYLSNDSDQILLWNSKGVLVDQVEYDTTLGWPLPTGASISLKKPSLNRNLGANWCAEQAAWFGSAGDRGTPGYPAQCL